MKIRSGSRGIGTCESPETEAETDMRLEPALKEHPKTLALGQATLDRLDLTEEASMPLLEDRYKITGAVVACNRALVVFPWPRQMDSRQEVVDLWLLCLQHATATD